MPAAEPLTQAKAALRRRMRQLRAAIPPDHAVPAATAAANLALALPELQAARTVGVYAPMRAELDITPVIQALRTRNIALAYPRVIPGQRKLAFHLVDANTTLVPTGKFLIPEPPPDSPQLPLTHIDVFFVPGLAFDRVGNRLGWGAAHYDTTLAASPRATRIGYAYDAQLIPQVPHDDSDVPMDILITERGVHRCPPRSR